MAGDSGASPVVMHWKSPRARSRIRCPSNCPGLLQKMAGTVVLVFSSHSTSHLILQSQASVLPRRSLSGVAPSHRQHPPGCHPLSSQGWHRVTPSTHWAVTLCVPRVPARGGTESHSTLPNPHPLGCHPVPIPLSPEVPGDPSQVTQDVQRLEEVPWQRLQVVVGQGPGGREGL